MKYVVILNESPYGSERSYNGLRLAGSLVSQEDTGIMVFLIGDGVFCAQGSQITPNGYYNVERMISALARKSVRIGVCGSCMDARGIMPESLVGGAWRSSMDELTAWTREADKVLIF